MPEYAYDSAEPTWSNSYLWPELLRRIRQAAPAPRAVFELGCGNGATARYLAQHGYSVTGVDPSTSGIAIAKNFASEQLHFEIGSTADDLAGRFGTFPVVVSLEVIEHCPSAREFMRAFASVLAPGGVGILSTPYHGYVKNLAVAAFNRFELRQLFAEFGFHHQEFHRVGRVPVLAKSVLAVIRRGVAEA